MRGTESITVATLQIRTCDTAEFKHNNLEIPYICEQLQDGIFYFA